jgi:hypothetical protein
MTFSGTGLFLVGRFLDMHSSRLLAGGEDYALADGGGHRGQVGIIWKTWGKH